MQFHERLKKYRKEKKLTQKELAEHLHVSRSAIAKWENGLGLPSNDSSEEIATFFETTREDLLADRETEMVIVEKNSALSRQKKWLITLVALVVALLVVSSVFLGIFLTSSKEPTTVGEDAEILGIEACFLAESDFSVNEGVKSVVFTHTYVLSRIVYCAALADKNVAGFNHLIAEFLDA